MADKLVNNHTPKSETEDPGLLEGIKAKVGCIIEERNQKKVEKDVEQYKAAMNSDESEEKKGYIEKIKEKLPGGDKKENDENAPTAVQTDHYIDVEQHKAAMNSDESEEKKGYIEKIKEKLPGGDKKEKDENAPTAVETDQYTDAEIEHTEKKGYF